VQPFLENHPRDAYHDFMTILGIETSCDETSAAVLRDGRVLSNVISSQLDHAAYGGVVPELASRAHQRLIIRVVDDALSRANTDRGELDAVAATYGPGLAGALLVGLSFAKGLAVGLGKPFVAVNHMEGHLYSNLLVEPRPDYPFLGLVVSGGHTMLVHVERPFRHALLGQTRDDAAGEAFDKVAKMLSLGYPGGPVIDRLSREGNPSAIPFPRSYLGEGNLDFSFSGVKTAVLYHLRALGVQPGTPHDLPARAVADICASFQASVVDVLVNKTIAAARSVRLRDIAVAGGVSANSSLRATLAERARKERMRIFFPPMEYCMDNGAMIALVGGLRLAQESPEDLEINVEASLSL
jgi:N6-L-threonylcarbamoyladenine synthase